MDVYKQIADAFTDKPEEFSYSLTPATKLGRFMHWLKRRPAKRSFLLQNLSPGNMVRISGVATDILADSLELGGKEQKRNMNRFLLNHADKLIYVVAVGLTNTKEEPPKWLLEELTWYVDGFKIQETAQAIFRRSQIEVFISTIVSISGQDILRQKASQQITGEIIAPGPLQEELQSTSESAPTM